MTFGSEKASEQLVKTRLLRLRVLFFAMAIVGLPTTACAHGIGILFEAGLLALLVFAGVVIVPSALLYLVFSAARFRSPAGIVVATWLVAIAVAVIVPSWVLPFSLRIHLATIRGLNFSERGFRTGDVPELVHAKGAHRDLDVRDEAEKVLLDFGVDAVPGLTKALRSPEDVVRFEAAKMLGDIDPPAAMAAPQVTAMVARETHPSVRAQGLHYLRKAAAQADRPSWIGEALPVATSLLARDSGTASAAADLLGALGKDGAPALPELLVRWEVGKKLRTDEQAEHLITAIRSICRSLGDRAGEDPTCRKVAGAVQ